MDTFVGLLTEVQINHIKSNQKLGLAKYVGVPLTDRKHGTSKHLSHIDKDHEFRKFDHSENHAGAHRHQYVVVHKPTGTVQSIVTTDPKVKSTVHHIDTTVAAKGNTMPVHKVYAHMIKKHGMTLVTGTSQSEGAKRVWEKLSKERGVNVHGWHHGKPVNLGDSLGMHNDHETHSGPYGDTTSARRMKLIAHGSK